MSDYKSKIVTEEHRRLAKVIVDLIFVASGPCGVKMRETPELLRNIADDMETVGKQSRPDLFEEGADCNCIQCQAERN